MKKNTHKKENLNKKPLPSFDFSKILVDNLPSQKHILIGVILGSISLFWYTTTNRITFPLSFAELPATALMLISLSIFIIAYFYFAFTFIFTLPFELDNAFKDAYKIGLKSIGKKEKLIKYLLLIVVPIFCLFSFMIISFESPIQYTALILTLLLFWIGIKKIKKDRNRVGIYILMQLVILSIWLTVVVFIPFTLVSIAYPEVTTKHEYALFYFLLIIGLTFFYCLVYKSKIQNQITKSKFPFILDDWILNIFKLVFIVIIIYPTSSSFVTSLSLRLMKLGGGYSAIYTFKSNYLDQINDDIKCKNSPTNRSKKLYVILALGGEVYIKLENKKHSNILAIPKDAIVESYYPGKSGLNKKEGSKEIDLCTASLLKI